MGIRLGFEKEQDLCKIPSFAGAIGRREDRKIGRMEGCPSSFHPSVQNALIERRVRKS